MIYIPVNFEVLRQNYARRIPNPDKPDTSYLENLDLRAYMKGLPPKNTPCCIQVSHALNLAGQTVGTDNPSGRRKKTEPIRVDGVVRNYVLAVDEIEDYLTWKYGAGLDVRQFSGLSGNSNDVATMKQRLSPLRGILVFRDPATYGLHTELWDGKRILQADINEFHMFTQPRVRFWICEPSMQSN